MKQVIQNMRKPLPEVLEVPTPMVRPGAALVRTAASLVSAGTERMLVQFAEKSLVAKARSRPDLVKRVLQKAAQEGFIPAVQAAFNRLDQGFALGYSSAGSVVEAGTGLQGFKAGDRVACAGGGYAVHAEYAVVPHNLLAHLPDGVDFDAGAFATLGAVALQGFRLAQPQLGESVAVIGLGLLGLLAAQIARSAGCRVFGVDVNSLRVALAGQMGVAAALRVEAVSSASGFAPLGFDVVLICADTKSNDPIELAGELARDRGRVIAVGAVGLDIPRKTYYDKELHFQVSRSYGPGRYDAAYEEGGHDYPPGYVRWTEGRNLQAFVDLLAEGKVDVKPLISHRFSIEHAAQAYALINAKQPQPYLGVLLTYPGGAEVQPGRQVSLRLPATPGAAAAPSQVTVGVLGAGNYANATFLPALHKSGVRCKVIASAAGLHARQAAGKFGFESAASDESAVLEDPEINAVVILTRHNEHARQAVSALQHGKHVYCEKPPALNQAELQQLMSTLQTQKSPLYTVGYNRRFAPLVQPLTHFFSGRNEPMLLTYRVNAGYLPLSHWTQDPLQGGGRVIGEGCHFIDLMTYLTGELPQSVACQSLPDQERYNQDNLILTVRFSSGSLGTLSYLANGDRSLPKERLEVFCAGKAAVLDDFLRLVLAADGHLSTTRIRRQDKGHRRAWAAFLDAVQTSVPPIPYAQIAAVSLATFAAMQSLRSGETINLRLEAFEPAQGSA